MKLNEKLKNERKSHKISQEALAEKMGVSRASVSAWESGIRIPSIKFLLMYTEIFSLEPDFFKEQNAVIDTSQLNTLGIIKLQEFCNFLLTKEEFRKTP